MSYFADLPAAQFEGPDSRNPLAYRYYQPDRLVLGKPMVEHLRPSVCYWHSFCWPGSDVFGGGTFNRPWLGLPDTLESARLKADEAFTFFQKTGMPYFAFHDVDAVSLGTSLREGWSNLDAIADYFAEKMSQTGLKLLWGTANLFSHPRYQAGGATNPDPNVFAYAAGQVRAMLDVTHRLGGGNYVLWGGREGYDTLLNTDMRQELDQLGRFLNLVVEHKHKIGFKGTILIEPKPCEPTKHQYDFDSATVHAFLANYGLLGEVKLNIEVNHATLAGHSFEHEIAYALGHNLLGSVDLNRGDPQNGWDTDQFPADLQETTLVLYRLLQAGGLETGGFNFDAKVRRQSIDAVDMLHGHVGGLDLLARALLNAEQMVLDGQLAAFVADRYSGWNSTFGADILSGKLSLSAIADAATTGPAPQPVSGRQEMLENLVQRFV
ncbi:xylose isomerase [Elstera sp.]|jgi:xylose isomerase|uniref:xylose isomerase n=1 Tax=Elstera sp. TaxID=1916664 RepID=UPI0037C11595